MIVVFKARTLPLKARTDRGDIQRAGRPIAAVEIGRRYLI